MKYEKKLTELQAEQASVGATQNAEPAEAWTLDQIRGFLRGFGLSARNVERIAVRWYADAGLARADGYEEARDAIYDEYRDGYYSL